MIKWRIDKNNKIPLYLQLKDLIKYYISTGTILDNQQLPGVNVLAKELGINFETVRKAYKEVEREGLMTMTRGKGTYVTLHKASVPLISPGIGPESEPVETIKDLIRGLLQNGMTAGEVKKIVKKAFDAISEESLRQFVIFTECNLLQVREISKLLEKYLSLKVKPVLLENLKSEVEKIIEEKGKILAIITTGFHINEVRDILKNRPVIIQPLITNMSLETRQRLDSLDEKACIGFVCRDRESLPFYRDLLKAELGSGIDLSCCIIEEESRVKGVLKSADLLLVSPPVYEKVKKMAPSRLPVFNVFDRVDPMSLKLIKDIILECI